MNPYLKQARRPLLECLGLVETQTLRTCIKCGSNALPRLIASKRPRSTFVHGHPSVYTDPEHAKAQKYIRELYEQARGTIRANYDGPVFLAVISHRHLPKSLRRYGSQQDLLKPDEDNILKLVQDALTGVAYKDDSQVVGSIPLKAPRRGEWDWYEIEITYCEAVDATRRLF